MILYKQRQKITKEMRFEINKLHSKGLSTFEIAKALKITEYQVNIALGKNY